MGPSDLVTFEFTLFEGQEAVQETLSQYSGLLKGDTFQLTASVMVCNHIQPHIPPDSSPSQLFSSDFLSWGITIG